jgi:hypothetical protein
VQLQVVPVRLDELAKRLLVASPGPGQQVRGDIARFPNRYVVRSPIRTDPARAANWAVPGRPVSGPAGTYLSDSDSKCRRAAGRI